MEITIDNGDNGIRYFVCDNCQEEIPRYDINGEFAYHCTCGHITKGSYANITETK